MFLRAENDYSPSSNLNIVAKMILLAVLSFNNCFRFDLISVCIDICQGNLHTLKTEYVAVH